MTEPVYNLTSLTDKQWDRQLASQEKMKTAELENAKQVELEKLRNLRELARGRRETINGVLVGFAILVALLAVIGSIFYGVQRGGERQHELGVQCVQSGGSWEEHEGRDGDRCNH
jgi:hypothetical protein